MKLHFEPNLDYQLQAIASVCDLFRGQEICRTEFTVMMPRQAAVAGEEVSDEDRFVVVASVFLLFVLVCVALL